MRSGITAAVAAFGIAAVAGFGPAQAQDWPQKPVRIVVPFGPGSGTDTGTRLIAQHLQTALGQPIVVENRPGANGTVAAGAVARAAPDGYTLLMGTNSTHGANPALYKSLPYEPAKDFVPVTLVGIFSSFLVVHTSVPAKSVPELIAYAKANPAALTYAAGSSSSLMMAELFKRGSGIEALKVQYASNPPAMVDVAAGRVSIMFPDINTAMPHVRSGAVRPLGVVTLGERSPLAPELPTVAEAAKLPDFHFVGWIGLFAPAGTPAPVVERLASETAKVLAMPEIQQRLNTIGAEARPMAPAAFREFVAAELQRLPKLLREIGVQPE